MVKLSRNYVKGCSVRPYSSGIRHDYKDSAPGANTFSSRGLPWFAIGLILPLVAVMLLLFSEPNQSMVPATGAADAADTIEASLPATPLVLLQSPGERVTLPLPPLSEVLEAYGKPLRADEIARNSLLSQGEAMTLVVRNGDSLDQLFRRNDLSVTDLSVMLALADARPHLARIRPADRIEIIRDGDHVLALGRDISESQRLWIRHEGEGYVAEIIDLAIDVRTAGAHGTIESSLWLAATRAGLDSDVIGALVGIFAWDIDFILNVRTGDNFTVVYEERWRDGVKLGNGDIIAAEFVNQGRTYRAARYIDSDGNKGHFTPEGINVKGPFLRAPFEITPRVSSSFNPRRRHPILNTIRAHKGTDYAAATGTPVLAAGAGTIIARGANGSYGNRIEIQHGGNITTLYAHLSRYGEFRVGDRVDQGQIIGFVGMTGSATGPHLHYEYRVNGVHHDSRTVDLPDAEPIPDQFRDDFMAKSADLWRQLELYETTTQVAQSVD
jgi:murein DD-endopeptidase MepM/ murein hydrolase activator NlpD